MQGRAMVVGSRRSPVRSCCLALGHKSAQLWQINAEQEKVRNLRSVASYKRCFSKNQNGLGLQPSNPN